MAFWNNEIFVGFGGLGLVVAAVLYFTGSGPFQPCVTNGFGVEYCGEEAKTYCRTVSDRAVGRTSACNEILGESAPVGAGQDPALDALESTGYDTYGSPTYP